MKQFQISILALLTLTIISCEDKYSKVEQSAIDYLQSQTLDPEQFETIKVKSTPYRESDSLVDNAYEIAERLQREIDFNNEIEAFKKDLKNYNVSRLAGYMRYEREFWSDNLRERQTALKENAYIPSYAGYKSQEAWLLGEIGVFRSLSGWNYSKSTERRFDSLINEAIPRHLKDSIDSRILYYNVAVRFYSMNRLGTRGISDAILKVIPKANSGYTIDIEDYTSF